MKFFICVQEMWVHLNDPGTVSPECEFLPFGFRHRNGIIIIVIIIIIAFFVSPFIPVGTSFVILNIF